MNAGIGFNELLRWIGDETDRYERWFASQAESVWSIPVGGERISTIKDLLHHVYAVDLRLAQRVHGSPIASDAEVAASDAAGLFALARRGQALLASGLTNAGNLEEMIAWQTMAGGRIQASKRKVIAHAITHHLRHFAQVATLLRLHGHPTDWHHDLLASGALV